MEFDFRLINESDINDIAKWQSEGDYIFYAQDKEEISLDALFNDDMYTLTSALDENDNLVGMIQSSIDDDAMLFACFLRPDLVGSGLDNDLVMVGINYVVEHFNFTGEKIKIVIEHYNHDAIGVLERTGFVIDDERADGQNSWIEMVLYL